MKFLSLFVLPALILAGTVPAIAADGTIGKTVEIAVKPEPWQERRAEFGRVIKAINESQGKDQKALARLDAILTGLEKDFTSITPMEAMDIYGAFYVPNEGATKMKELLVMVSAIATLGWYDTLRFADASGRAEIVNNERFFLRPFALGGPEGVRHLTEFLEKHPKEAEEAVRKGTEGAFARKDKVNYDVHWPTAYGLARMSCAMEGRADCPKPAALPKEQWDDKIVEAVLRVREYYRDNSGKR